MASYAKFDVWQTSAGVTQATVIGYNYYRLLASSDTYVTISGDTDYDTTISVTYTPKYSNSILYVEGVAQTRAQNAYGMSMGIKRDGVKQLPNYNVGGNDFFYKGASLNHHINMRSTIAVTANSTSSTTFTVWLRPYSGGGGSGEWAQGWGQHFISVMEIAQ